MKSRRGFCVGARTPEALLTRLFTFAISDAIVESVDGTQIGGLFSICAHSGMNEFKQIAARA